MVVRCTARLLKLLPQALEHPPPEPSPDDLHANLLWLDGRKCLLVVHAETLFAVLIPDVRKRQLHSLGDLLADRLAVTLDYEGLAPDGLGRLDPKRLDVTRTASRSVVGFMNDMAFQAQRATDAAGGLPALDVAKLNARLNRTPYNRGRYVLAIDHVRLRQRSR